MCDGERLLRWLALQDVDRPSFFEPWGPWEQTIDRWWAEAGLPLLSELKPNAMFDFDFGYEVIQVPMGIYPPFERQIVQDHGDTYLMRDERGILLRQKRDMGSLPGYLENPVKGWDDWERLKKERLDPDHPGRYTLDWDLLNSHLARTGAVAQLGDYPYGVLGQPAT